MRGERVKEFNLCPLYYKKKKSDYFDFGGQKIPLISEGWLKIKDHHYIELETPYGTLLTCDFVYKIDG